MNYDMKRPCPECPYVGKIPGWIGEHDTAQDFVDFARGDFPFPCHMTIDWRPGAPPPVEQAARDSAARCAGQALFMNKMLKTSQNEDMARMQHRLRREEPGVEVLWPPEKLVEHHRCGSAALDVLLGVSRAVLTALFSCNHTSLAL
jgi:hypothetical protein